MDGFSYATDLADVPDGGVVAVEVEGVEIALTRCGEEVFAVRDECSHAAVPLSEGDVEDCTLECWLHGSRFDARTGEVLNLPATEPVPVYPAKVTEDGGVLVDVSSPSI
ncbi:3-phenylpropionate/trans-cinnamate dioxygenase ferredoxin subunit [Mumia flava]|uniref:3-phenylpropionate/trans-cinnamate dioxygenase ferredoxin subunit n=1 Tax=Mumia flava TaxID=1348852 RepID=A0A0B2B8Y1_9ACTN|nr:non-heme iron oxygenase ferredoxin subunit [Mumia flava]PJJ53588.1 3-phenylpropionate/trans-cinnamate dioxygenase ferredoxin subunit [Mumia flava]